MLNIGGPELLIILLVALVVLGPERLPGAARQIGRTVNQLRSMAQGFQKELEASTKPLQAPLPGATDPEQIRTAAKASGSQMFGGTGLESDDGATSKPVSQGGPAEPASADSLTPTADETASASSEPAPSDAIAPTSVEDDE